MNASDWSLIINKPAYKLNLQNIKPYQCTEFSNGLVKKKIHIQMFDRYNRASNIVTREIDFKTATLMYSNYGTDSLDNSKKYVSLSVDGDAAWDVHEQINITYDHNL